MKDLKYMIKNDDKKFTQQSCRMDALAPLIYPASPVLSIQYRQLYIENFFIRLVA